MKVSTLWFRLEWVLISKTPCFLALPYISLIIIPKLTLVFYTSQSHIEVLFKANKIIILSLFFLMNKLLMNKLETYLVQRWFSFYFVKSIIKKMTHSNNFKASVCFFRKSVNKTFIIQNCANIPTKKQNKYTKDRVTYTKAIQEICTLHLREVSYTLK